MLAMSSTLQSQLTVARQRGGKAFALACPTCTGGAVGVEVVNGGPFESRPPTRYAVWDEHISRWYAVTPHYDHCPNCRPQITL